MIVQCPHCNKNIDLIGAAELKTEYGISQNPADAARKSGKLIPWLQFNNRFLYLRSAVEDFRLAREMDDYAKIAERMAPTINDLPPSKRKEVMRELQRMLEE